MASRTRIIPPLLATLAGFALLGVLRSTNPLLLYCLEDSFCMLVAGTVFAVAWNTRSYSQDSFLPFLGSGFFFVAAFTLFHMLTQPGTGFFSGQNKAMHAGLEIAARGMETAALLGAPLVLGRAFPFKRIVWFFSLLAAVFIFTLWTGIFASATAFQGAGYTLLILLCVAGGLFYSKRKRIGAATTPYFFVAVAAGVCSGLAAGLSSAGGLFFATLATFLQLLSLYGIYQGSMRAGLSKPYSLILRNLKAKEEELEKSKKNFQILIEASPCAITLSDTDGRLTFISRQASTLFALETPLSVLGQPLEIWVDAGHQRTFSNDLTMLRKNGTTTDALPKEYLMQKANGERFWCSITTGVLRSADNTPVGFISIMQDITERKNRENALYKSEAQLRQAQSIAMIGSFEFHFRSGVSHWSRELARLFDVSPEYSSTSFDAFLERIHTQDAYKFTELFQHAGQQKQFLDFEVRYQRRGNETGHARVMGSLFRDATGNAQKLVGTFQDITERKTLESLKEDVDRIMHHDLRTPLTALTGLPHLLENDANLTDGQRKIISEIIAAGQRALDQVNLFRDLYQIENGSYVFEPRPVELVSVLRQIANEMHPKLLAQKSAIRLHIEGREALPSDTLFAAANELLCFSMLANLIDNALDATPRGKPVSVNLRNSADVSIEIHNHGQVPPEIQSRFFEKYATFGKNKGTGLGTYNARLMALTQHGDIKMETSQETGTTLRVTLCKATK